MDPISEYFIQIFPALPLILFMFAIYHGGSYLYYTRPMILECGRIKQELEDIKTSAETQRLRDKDHMYGLLEKISNNLNSLADKFNNFEKILLANKVVELDNLI